MKTYTPPNRAATFNEFAANIHNENNKDIPMLKQSTIEKHEVKEDVNYSKIKEAKIAEKDTAAAKLDRIKDNAGELYVVTKLLLTNCEIWRDQMSDCQFKDLLNLEIERAKAAIKRAEG